MAQQVLDLKCSGCGAKFSACQTECDYCHSPVVISTFNSVYAMTMPQINQFAGANKKALANDPDNIEINNSIAMCFLKLKQYDKAHAAFEKAMVDNFDNSETFFYAAVALLNGKRPFQAGKAVVDRALSYLESAMMIEPRGIYYYFSAYLRYDYYYLKKLRVSPDYVQYLKNAKDAGGVPSGDVTALSELLGYQIVMR